MTDLKIRIFKNDQEKPETVVTIPLKIVRTTAGLLPKKAKEALEKEGIDLNEIASLIEKQESAGKLVEVEKEGERIVITIE